MNAKANSNEGEDQSNAGTSDSSFFSKPPVLNTDRNSTRAKFSPEMKRYDILADIRKHPNSNVYQIAKRTGINYSQVHQILRELVFARLLCLKQGFDSNDVAVELFFVPPVEEVLNE